MRGPVRRMSAANAAFSLFRVGRLTPAFGGAFACPSYQTERKHILFFKKKTAGFLIVGLGNPGKQYERSRHNAGFNAVDFVADELGVRIARSRFGGLTGEGRIADVPTVFLKPLTFMNLSGNAVAAAAQYYNLPPENVIVIFDDVSLEPGCLRIRVDGSAGGHNGVKSIIASLGSDAFPRIKIGVGKKPHPDADLADWVLSSPSHDDRLLIEKRFSDILPACELIVSGQTGLAQSRFNG